MKINVAFPIEVVKAGLETPPNIFENTPEANKLLVALPFKTKKHGEVHIVFARSVVLPLYTDAVQARQKTVVIPVQSPTKEQYEQVGLKLDGDTLIPIGDIDEKEKKEA